jgi:hypothetical protein
MHAVFVATAQQASSSSPPAEHPSSTLPIRVGHRSKHGTAPPPDTHTADSLRACSSVRTRHSNVAPAHTHAAPCPVHTHIYMSAALVSSSRQAGSIHNCRSSHTRSPRHVTQLVRCHDHPTSVC